MSTWTTRIKSRMRDLKMTQEMLANKIGITRGAITHYLAGRRQPPLKQFQKLAAILKVDPAWLQYGTENTNTKKTKSEKPGSEKNLLPLLSWEQVAKFTNVSKIKKTEIKEFVPHFYIDKPRWYALRIKGDAMIAPTSHSKSFHEGDIIMVDPDKKVVHGSYVVAVLPKSKEATFKQYVVDGGVHYLKPLNQQYPMVQIKDSTHICGVVLGCLGLFT